MDMQKIPRRTKFDYDLETFELFLICQRHEAALSGNAYKMHVFQVFMDTEFKTEVESLRQLLEKKYGKDVSFIFPILSTTLEDKYFKLLKRLANKYAISLLDLYIFADGHFAAGLDYGKTDSVVEGVERGIDGQLYYRIDATTTMESIRLHRKDIEMMQKVIFGNAHRKKKGAENPDLLYAIFKAKGSKSFKQIFEEYREGSIGSYKVKNTKQFNGYESLQRYYNKHAFDVPAS
jgi:hypothetical protein